MARGSVLLLSAYTRFVHSIVWSLDRLEVSWWTAGGCALLAALRLDRLDNPKDTADTTDRSIIT